MTWQRVLRVGGTMLLAGLSAFGAATLVVGVDLGFEAAIMAGIAAFFANVFMIDGLAETKCCAIVAATMNARCEPSSRTRPRPQSTRNRRWTWARHRTVCWAAFIARMMAAGQSWNTIQSATGCSRATIAKIAKRLKVAA